jgi:hypothetical protein
MRTNAFSFLTMLASAMAAATAPAPDERDYQKIADKEEWKWEKDRASAVDSAKNFKGDFKAEVIDNKVGGFTSTTVKFAKGDDVILTVEGHAGTAFAGLKDVVYYADFSAGSSGCRVIAYNLKEKKQLWKTDLKGLGPISHFRYRNAVILDIKDDAVHILGNESAGQYVEYLDPKTGKTVGNRVFDKKGGKEE